MSESLQDGAKRRRFLPTYFFARVPRGEFAALCFKFWCALTCALACLSIPVAHVLWMDTQELRWFAMAAFLSHQAMLAAPVALLAWVCGAASRRRIWAYGAMGVCGFALALFVLYDVSTFKLYAYHVNGMVLNLLTNPATSDSVRVSVKTWIEIWVRVLAMGVGYTAFMTLFLWTDTRRARRGKPPLGWKRVAALLCVCAAAVCAEKTFFAWLQFKGSTEGGNIRMGLAPLYVAPTAHPLFAALGYVRERDFYPYMPKDDEPLRYPRAPLDIAPPARPPNVLIMVIESATAATLTPELTPHAWALARDYVSAPLHTSGGNATRFGFFTLFYGLYGTYWHPFLTAKRSPVLLDVARARDYRIRAASATNLNFPELRDTVFHGLREGEIFDAFSGTPFERDRAVADALIDLIQTPDERPFFGVAFMDSPHFPYSFPVETARCRPYLPEEEIEVFSQGVEGDPDTMERLRNRHRNAVAHSDAQIGRVLAALRASGKFENTAIFIVGDHGEEFCELGAGAGHFGHGAAYTREQTAPLFAAHLPNVGKRRIERITSHYDIVPTLLPFMGVANPADDYANGVSLLSDSARRCVFVASWGDAALTDGTYVMHVGTTPRTYGFLRLLGPDYKRVQPALKRRAILHDWEGETEAMVRGQMRFFQHPQTR